MLLRFISKHVKEQDWFAVVLDFSIIGDRLLPKNTTSPNKPAAAINNAYKAQYMAVLPVEDFSHSNDQPHFVQGITNAPEFTGLSNQALLDGGLLF